jgi:hypothetical protein
MQHILEYQDYHTDLYWDSDGERITREDLESHLSPEEISMDPSQISHLLIDTERDPLRVERADLNFPIYLAQSQGNFTSILDGQHRVVKALRDGADVRVKTLNLDLAPHRFRRAFSTSDSVQFPREVQ